MEGAQRTQWDLNNKRSWGEGLQKGTRGNGTGETGEGRITKYVIWWYLAYSMLILKVCFKKKSAVPAALHQGLSCPSLGSRLASGT